MIVTLRFQLKVDKKDNAEIDYEVVIGVKVGKLFYSRTVTHYVDKYCRTNKTWKPYMEGKVIIPYVNYTEKEKVLKRDQEQDRNSKKKEGGGNSTRLDKFYDTIVAAYREKVQGDATMETILDCYFPKQTPPTEILFELFPLKTKTSGRASTNPRPRQRMEHSLLL